MANTHRFRDNSMGTPIDVRAQVRDGAYNIDAEINNDLGFDEGVENTDWMNLEQHSIPEIIPALSVDPLIAGFDLDGTPQYGNVIIITSNVAWTATPSAADIYVDKESGMGNDTITITVDAGAFGEPIGTVTLSAGGVDDVIITINRSS